MKNNLGSQEIPIATNEASSVTPERSEVDLSQALTEPAKSQVSLLPDQELYKTYKGWLLGNAAHNNGEPPQLEFIEETPEMLKKEALSKQEQLEVFFEYIKEQKLEIPDELDTKYRNLREKIKAISRSVKRMEGKAAEENIDEIGSLHRLFDAYVSLATDIDSMIDAIYAKSQSERVTEDITKRAEQMLSALDREFIDKVQDYSNEMAGTLITLRAELLNKRRELRLYLE